jgi:chromosome segregation ATPase
MDNWEERRSTCNRLSEELHEVAVATVREALAAGKPQSLAGDHSQRLATLEEQVRELGCVVDARSGGAYNVQALAAFENRLDAHKSEVEDLTRQVAESARELRSQVTEQMQKQMDQKEALSTRVDDINLRLGASKVKVDGLDNRLHSGLERLERASAERSRDADADVQQRLGQFTSDADKRLDVFEGRLDALEDACEETVEKALERRLALLSGTDLGFQVDRKGNWRDSSSPNYGKHDAGRCEYTKPLRGTLGISLPYRHGTPAYSTVQGDLSKRFAMGCDL